MWMRGSKNHPEDHRESFFFSTKTLCQIVNENKKDRFDYTSITTFPRNLDYNPLLVSERISLVLHFPNNNKILF